MPSTYPSFAPSTMMPTMAPSKGPSLAPTMSTWNQIGNDLDGIGPKSESGKTVSLSNDGTTVAIGGWLYDGDKNVNGTTDIGYVRVYKYFLNTWARLGPDIFGAAENQGLGDAVSLSGDGFTLAVLSYSSLVGVYRFGGFNNTWVQLGDEWSDGYGGNKDSLDISDDGSTVAIGSPRDWMVRVYRFNETSVDTGGVPVGIWNQMGSDIEGRLTNDTFGTSVQLTADGNTVIVGAPGTADEPERESDGDGTDKTGYAQVFSYSQDNDAGPTDWSIVGITIEGEGVGDEAGFTVSISADGETIGMSAILNDVGGENSGHVRVFRFDRGNKSWRQLGNTIIGEQELDNSGFGLALSGDGTTICIGAPGNKGRPETGPEPVNFNAGHVRVYRYDNVTEAWKQAGADIEGEYGGDNSGYDVAVSFDGKVVAIGSPFNAAGGYSKTGSVRVFEAPF